MSPTVAIVAPGHMGAALGQRLVQGGATVLTWVEGRSAATRRRAEHAGLRAVALSQCLTADILLSVLPPEAAPLFVQQLVPLLRTASSRPLFVECNPLGPAVVQRLADALAEVDTILVDGGIIGPPPAPDNMGPRLYVSGEQAARVCVLSVHGLDVRVLAGPIGAASALKLSFAGINKGLLAVATAMMLAATRAGVDAALRQELSQHWPTLFTSLTRQIPDMLPKAYRWDGEMHEIAAFVETDTAARDLYRAAGELYRRIAEDFRGEGRESALLTEFFAGARR